MKDKKKILIIIGVIIIFILILTIMIVNGRSINEKESSDVNHKLWNSCKGLFQNVVV